MNSPFPGMDPYLEQHWRDVHSRLVTYASDALQALLPADLLARVEERVYVESDEAFRRAIYPYVRVVEHGVRGPGGQATQELAGRNGRYHTLDYTIPPDPPLDASDDDWANELLVAKGLRKHPG